MKEPTMTTIPKIGKITKLAKRPKKYKKKCTICNKLRIAFFEDRYKSPYCYSCWKNQNIIEI